MLPGASEQDALERYGDDLWAMLWKYSDMEASATRPGPPPSPPPTPADRRELVTGRSTIAGPVGPDRRDAARHPPAGGPARRVRRSQLLPRPWPTSGRSSS